jgi:hypothetical protein
LLKKIKKISNLVGIYGYTKRQENYFDVGSGSEMEKKLDPV